MQADPWWSAAMAINVYMVFFRGHNPTSFRRQLWVYNALCFGVPAVPAFICLLVRPSGRPMYGDSIVRPPVLRRLGGNKKKKKKKNVE